MSFEWPIFQIQDVCSVGDGAHSKVQRTDAGILYLTSKNIGNGTLKLDKIDYISEESFDKLFPANSKATRRPQTGDLLMGIIGTFGNSYLYKESDTFGFSSSIGIIRPNNEKLRSQFLYYVISSPKFKSIHAAVNGGSAQGYTNIPSIKKLPIYVPPLHVQDAVADLLGSLDDRIALLRETNVTLESIAQALFKSWFVDFDPVQAKTEGREPEGLSAEVAGLFPDSFDTSELGLIPQGWSQTTLGQVCARHGGSIQTGPFGSQLHASDYVVAGVPVIMPKDLANRRVNEKSIARIQQSDADRLSRHKVQAGDIVFSRRGDVERHALIGNFEAGWICGTGCLLVRPGSAWPSTTFLSMALDEQRARKWLVRHAVGATMPNLNTGILADVPLVTPQTGILDAFENIVASTEEKRSANYECIQVLTALRDALLPRLISGQLRLPEAETLLRDVA